MAKRSDYISWDEYFMGVAILAAQRSKDPNTQAVSYTHLSSSLAVAVLIFILLPRNNASGFP